jgi:2-dehydro-3-deoxygalactonokinase
MEERASTQGILTVKPGEFAATFDALFHDWMASGPDLVLISGMAGSQQGWREAPYCPCPAGFDEIARQLT